MTELYSNLITNTTKKRCKVNRSQPAIARKVIAFQEILDVEQNRMSEREAAHLLNIPNSTMQSWQEQRIPQNISSELEAFFLTPTGANFLQRNVMAVMKLMKCGPVGIRGMQEYLRHSGLDKFVASSEGALQNFWMRCEAGILKFGEQEEKKLASGMRSRKITIGLDELFRSRRPCLVGIEVVSNYILLEKFTEDRTAETWVKELKARLQDMNVEVGQVVSDLSTGICACTKELEAKHIPELFHAQYEISKATSAPLASQERGAEKAFKRMQEREHKVTEKPLRIMKEAKKQQKNEIEEAKSACDKLKKGFEEKVIRRKKVQEAIKEMGNIHHPIDLRTGVLQGAAIIEKRFDKQFSEIQKCAKEAQLSESSIERIAKGKRVFDAIIGYINYFFIFYMSFVDGLCLCAKEEYFFNTVVFPLCYFKMIWRRLPKKAKEEHQKILKVLECKFQEASWPEDFKREWMKKGRELAETFQRSSSCVEGRNSVLSLNHHRFHRLSARSLRVLTIVHNFDIRRPDGTTAAERFFEAKHENLFDFLVATVRIPGRPHKQHHDMEKRLLGWEKRRKALLAA